jgi:hypothetical protein
VPLLHDARYVELRADVAAVFAQSMVLRIDLPQLAEFGPCDA